MTSLTLKINSVTQTRESVADDWQAVTYVLSSAARDTGQPPLTVDLEDDDVLELELTDGTRLLVAPEDAERYLGRAIGRGEGTAGELQVGPALRLSGPHLPPGPSRDGFGAWVLKALRVFRQGPAGVTAVAAAGAFQDHQLEHRTGLQRLDTEQWGLTAIERIPPSDQPVLLFLHGTASSTAGSFQSLWGGDPSEMDARGWLRDRYGERIYGFEHRSLTDSPVTNVLELVRRLPEGARLHLVSHSRGGMLGELLARANRADAEPFTEADVRRFLEHGRRTGRIGYEEDAERLRELNREMRERSLRIERFVRVAATARGTTLASGRLDRWASVMLNLLGGVFRWAGPGYDLLTGFLLAVVKERTDARVLPGLEAMMPDSPLVALLNAPEVELAYPLHVIAGDYRGDGLLSWLGDSLSEAFYGGATDLVVNTPSMSGGAQRQAGIFERFVSGAKVTHFSYFERKESAEPLLEALAGRDHGYQRLAGPSRLSLARGGKHTKPKTDAPIALMLPGIMGSHLALRGDRIWFDPFDMVRGGMSELKIDAQGVIPVGWMDPSYEEFAQHLAQTHEVRPFAYDWRRSIVQAAEGFGLVLDQALTDAEQRRQPLRIVAHSMGGLVARLALQGRWERLKALPGSRLVQFGTPNNGSHSIAAVLMGRDAFVQKIERWFDWKHDMREFLDIVRQFPGVLELLPWPLKDGRASDGRDYFDPALWEAWAAQDTENRHAERRDTSPRFDTAKGAGDGWPAPDAGALKKAREAIARLQQAPLDRDCTLYVAGRERTPVALRLQDGRVEIGWSDQGDGRVAWATGIPQGVKVWYVDAAHGDLLDHAPGFDEYVTLLETGNCRLDTALGGKRGSDSTDYAPAPLALHTLYPSAQEVLTAALGGRLPRPAATTAGLPTRIELVHGNLAGADTPVLIGVYAFDPIGGSAAFLDQHLGGALSRAQALGRYPNLPDDAKLFPAASKGSRPGGAIVVGLGPLGELQPGVLSRALANGIKEYAQVFAATPTEGERELELSAMLVGTGYAGLSVALGVRALADALRLASLGLQQAGMTLRIARLTLFEEEEARAIAAAHALSDLASDGRYAQTLSYDGRIRLGEGRYRGSCEGLAGAGGWRRVHITADRDGGLRFTLMTDRARNQVDEEPNQRQAVDGLIRTATNGTLDQPGLSRALFELMVPNGFKEALPNLNGLILGVDASAAAYPWELMRDEQPTHDAPLATRIGVVRQLATPHGRRRVETVEQDRVLVVGDTQSGFAELRGAQREGRRVASQFDGRGFEVVALTRPDGQTVFVNLFDGRYRIIHLAAHGSVAEDGAGETGMLLGPDTYLTTAQISKLRRVPELVFLNCCHLGSMDADAHPRWGKLAANLATEFIEMGCKAVIAAGWAVDDGAAETFAGAFYRAMLDGRRFGDAVRDARRETWLRHRDSNTWGAYQAYGDERYGLINQTRDDDVQPDYLHAGQIVADLDRLRARIGPAGSASKGDCRRQLERIEDTARARYFQIAAIREQLGAAWADLEEKERAIAHYRAALVQEDSSSSLHALEQLANLEVRLGAERLRRKDGEDRKGLSKKQQLEQKRQASQLMATGEQRLRTLLALGESVERLSLLGSAWKHRASVETGKRRIDSALKKMVDSYRKASDLSRAQGAERDYYPSLNALDGALLLGARGDRAQLDELTPRLQTWLAESRRNGQRRYAEQRSFFNAFSELDCARVDALWAMFDGRDTQALSQTEVRARLVARHRDLLRRLGSEHAHDSARYQFQWLIELLPDGDLRKALTQLQEDIDAP